MKYSVGNNVKLKNDYTMKTGDTIAKGTPGVVRKVKRIMLLYEVDFTTNNGVLVSDNDLE